MTLAIDAGLHPLADGTAPEWATAWGEDRFGVYADFAVGEVMQRMRWIPPGQFSMGSPSKEVGRFDAEEPLHQVSLARGYWIFDTPCTQALWTAVMRENPSSFQTPDRPVESVGIDEVKKFISLLNEGQKGLNLTLPSEAEWEYACRAGTTGPNYLGTQKSLGKIAWFDQNSGKDSDLKTGGQDQGTRPVGLKTPNVWGLYDMLGNVWEWCADVWHDNYDGAPTDGSAWIDDGSALRVNRGGSWNLRARIVRAACRNRIRPSYRSGYLGFRCARVQSESEAERRAERREPSERSETASPTGPERFKA